jgi:hypothetical protein
MATAALAFGSVGHVAAQASPDPSQTAKYGACGTLPFPVHSFAKELPDSLKADSGPVARPPLPYPQYPSDRKYSGTRANVLYRFVVDSTGMILPCSITVQSATDFAFVESGRQALLQARFTPGRKGEHPVAVLSQLRMRWEMK